MRIALAQLNPVVGDVEGNLRRLRTVWDDLPPEVELLILPELYLVGYPPRDLLERASLLERVDRALDEILDWTRSGTGTGILVGLPWRREQAEGKGLHNSAALVARGELLAVRHKSLLPDYDVFDERRYFDPAPEIRPVEFAGERLGITICEDSWNDPGLWPRRPYQRDPMAELARQGATLLLNISASPFHDGKEEERYRLLRGHAGRHRRPLVMVNQVGGNDELVFDGRSLALDDRGEPSLLLPGFQEALEVVESGQAGRPGSFQPAEPVAAIRDALVLGLRDYMTKCGFRRAVLGLSGGIDSALVCDLAVEALGAENVLGVTMPSPYSAGMSAALARELSVHLGIQCREIPIDGVYRGFLESLGDGFDPGGPVTLAMENLQARARGTILMALANQEERLVLATGNKSEMAVGYCTLYGDMCGGLSVLADVPKTMVYQLARHANRDRPVIPTGIIQRPPTAELRPDQRDSDSLPPYDVLDPILHHYIEENRAAVEIVALGFEAETVRWVIRAVNRSEYKRRQAAPGIKVTSKAFGMGRRIPIAARHEE